MTKIRILLLTTNDIHKAMFAVAVDSGEFNLTISGNALEALNFATMMESTCEPVELIVVEPPLNELTPEKFITKLRSAGMNTPVLLVLQPGSQPKVESEPGCDNVRVMAPAQFTNGVAKVIRDILNDRAANGTKGARL